MAKKQGRNAKVEEEFKKVTEPTREEINTFREQLNHYKQKVIFGKLYSKFDQYCEAKAWIWISQDGMTVRDPLNYSRALEMHQRIQNYDYHRLQEHFQAYPEEREKHISFVREIGKEIKKLSEKMSFKS